MGFPAHKLQVVLGELAPDLLGVLAAPRDAKLNLGAGETSTARTPRS